MNGEWKRVGCTMPEVVRIEFDMKATSIGATMTDILRVAVEAFLLGDKVDFGDAGDISMMAASFQHRAKDKPQGGPRE